MIAVFGSETIANNDKNGNILNSLTSYY
jgi:hypothetical protein